MRVVLERSVVAPHVSNVNCNQCGRDIDKDQVGYFEDHVSLEKTWGYHSPYDGDVHIIDICVDCYTDWINNFEIPPHHMEA